MRVVLSVVAAAGLIAVLACASQQPVPQSPGGGVIVEGADAGAPTRDAGVLGPDAGAGRERDAGVIERTAEGVGEAARKAGEAAGRAVEGAASAAGAAVGGGPPGPPPADISHVQLPPAPAVPRAPAFLGEVQDPPDNPTTPEKVHLGWQLFFDKRLSKSGQMSCESCHHPELAWTSGDALDRKDDGTMNKRNAPPMWNLGYHTSFYWDGRMPTLEKVTAAAWKGQLAANPPEIAARLNAVAVYRAEFRRAFQQDANPDNVAMALSAFLRALKSGDAPYDRFEQGVRTAVSKRVQSGRKVYEDAGCSLCHAPPLYTDAQFHNAGIGWDKPDRDHGRMDATKDEKDDGKFKTPSLREIVKTGPYFHDGSAKTLDEAIDVMAAGGRPNPNLDEKLKPHRLSARDKANLKAFLESLTGKQTFTKAPELP